MKKSKKNQKKIRLIIFPGYFLPHLGGLETHVDEFVKYLLKEENLNILEKNENTFNGILRYNYEIVIFTPNIPLVQELEFKYDKKLKIIRYPAFDLVSNFPFPKFWLPRFWKLYLNLYFEDFDIVMSRTRFFINSFLALIFAKFRLNRKKFIHVEHGSEFVILESRFKSRIAYIYDITLGKIVFRLADKNIAISHTVKNFIGNNFINLGKVNVPIISRGVDFEVYKSISADKEISSKFKDKIILSFVGRLYKWKGLENSIKAYISLDDDLKEKSVFIIVGDGEDMLRLKKVAIKYLDNGIYFLGSQSFNRAIAIMKASDIYVHSAYKGGGLSNSLLQAMYCSCAVVASPNEGANEVIFNDENGILLKNNSFNSLKFGMEKLILSENLRKKYSLNAKKYIGENFSWDKVILKYEKEFEDLLYKN